MSEDKSSKTEQATPHKKKQAKKKGQVAKSQDIGIATGLLAGFGTIIAMGKISAPQMLEMYNHFTGLLPEIGRTGEVDWTAEGFYVLKTVVILSLPVLVAVMITAFVTQISQTGIIFTGEQIKPSLKKINPLSGIKKWFAIKSIVELFKSICKILITFFIGILVWRGFQDDINASPHLGPEGIMALGGAIVSGLFWKVLVLYVTIGVIDVFFQRWQHNRDLKMSKKELKDEYKNMEGDPYMKAKRRQVHQQIAQQAAAEDNVPYADGVIINPTELAIAIKYDPERSPVPYVVAKGEKRLADRIREVASGAGIPVVRNKPLARGLYEACEIGDLVPPELYKPVAEVLAYIFSLDAEAGASRQQAAEQPGQSVASSATAGVLQPQGALPATPQPAGAVTANGWSAMPPAPQPEHSWSAPPAQPLAPAQPFSWQPDAHAPSPYRLQETGWEQ